MWEKSGKNYGLLVYVTLVCLSVTQLLRNVLHYDIIIKKAYYVRVYRRMLSILIMVSCVP